MFLEPAIYKKSLFHVLQAVEVGDTTMSVLRLSRGAAREIEPEAQFSAQPRMQSIDFALKSIPTCLLVVLGPGKLGLRHCVRRIVRRPGIC